MNETSLEKKPSPLWKKLLLLAVFLIPALYLGGIALLWFRASQIVKAPLPPPRKVVHLPERRRVISAHPAQAEAPAAKEEVPVPEDTTDFGPTNYNPWTDEPPH